MAATAPQVGDLVELVASATDEGAVSLAVVRAVRPAGGYSVSLTDNPSHQITVQDSDIAGVYANVGSGAAIQQPTEAVLVSGVDTTLGPVVLVTLTAARLVGAPVKSSRGEELEFEFIQGGSGGYAVTWNAAFKVTWADTGNTTGKRSCVRFRYDGTNWNQIAAQAAYV